MSKTQTDKKILLYHFADTGKGHKQIVLYFKNYKGEPFVTPIWSSESTYSGGYGTWYGYDKNFLIKEFKETSEQEFKTNYPEYFI